jgi:hypothetical protein
MLALTLHFSDCRINQHCLPNLTINQMPKKPENADCAVLGLRLSGNRVYQVSDLAD